MSNLPKLLAATACAVLLAAGTADAQDQKVTIRFAAMVGDKPFACGQSYEGVGASGSRITPSDFRFYISNIELIDTEGKAVPVRLDQDGVW
jgi:hypothetical protein